MTWDLDDDGWAELLQITTRSARAVLHDCERSADVAMQAIERLLVLDRRGHERPADLGAYAWTVAHHAALDYLASAPRRREVPTADPCPPARSTSRPTLAGDIHSAGVGGAHLAGAARAAQQRLFELPDPCDVAEQAVASVTAAKLAARVRAVLPPRSWPVWERHVAGCSGPEIAAMLSRSDGAVRMTILRARQAVQLELADQLRSGVA
ncbi:MAG TPA: hypothetical protein VMD59_08355 [Acidimicrobiales bacterium]|nr:hypothetical protein [Acidimicrobiales bacterium]